MLEQQQMLKKRKKKESYLSSAVLCIIFPVHWRERLMQIPQTGKQVWESTTLWESCPSSQSQINTDFF